MLIVIHLSSQTSWAHRLLCTSVRTLKKQGAHNWTRPEHTSCAEKGLSSVGSTKNPTVAFLLPSLSCSSEALRMHITKQREGKTRVCIVPFTFGPYSPLSWSKGVLDGMQAPRKAKENSVVPSLSALYEHIQTYAQAICYLWSCMCVDMFISAFRTGIALHKDESEIYDNNF